MAKVQVVDMKDSIQDILRIIDEDGCVVIRDAINSDGLKKLQNEMNDLLNNTSVCAGDFYGYQTKRISGLIKKSPQTRELAIHPVILSVMDEVLLRSCEQYQLNLTQAIQIYPSEPQQIIHRDDSMFPFGAKRFEAMINCMWAVDDFTFENGATHVVPGSHKWDLDRQPKPEEVTYGEMPAGSVLIYLGSLLHNGGANISSKPRTGLVVSYCNGWLRQAENQYLAVPLSDAANYSECLQRLMGYFVHKPNLGCVEGRDPIEILKDQRLPEGQFTEFLPDAVKPILKDFRQNLKKAA
ncbi:MAG: phytanoyl-CoA dioxygenase family protein [Alphaproteobacteria bacterium]|nr:phytanoyl-CoA dioxygenase family protein [Alphaproteobacteria bacterium]